ncbi:OmpA family protein [Olleya namhaensis]|uniref:Outer membrane protein OmpA n=1 Tax=Olleya namhaensis TaxID=1144750 RepID=A0A1I3R0A9_9FLAO|nr:OmpA family protein [Olleya namhaensis]SFJ38837.1 Outer membrane protein OmpA [Olleya namhaensis]
MSTNLLNLFKEQLSDNVLSNVSNLVGGEKTETIQKGLMAAAPALLGGIMDKASTTEGAASIFNMLGDGAEMGNLSNALGAGGEKSDGFLNKGLDFVKNILGDKASGVIDLVSSVSGMGKDSSSSILSVAGSVLGGVLGKQKSSGMDLGSFVGMLSGQGSFLDKFAPAGLASLLGLSSFSGISDKLGSLAGGALGFAGDTGKAALDGAGKLVGGAADVAGNLGKGAVDGAGKIIGGTAGVAGNLGKGAVDGAGKIIGGAAGVAGNLGKGAVDGVGKIGGAAAGVAGNVGKGAIDGVGKIGGAAAGLAGSAGKAGGSLIKKILPWAIGIIGLLLAFFLVKGCDSDKSILDNVKNAANETTGAISNTANSAVDAAGNAVNKTVDAAGNAVDATGNAIGNTVDAAGNVINKTVDAAGNAVDATGKAIGNVAGGIVDASGNVVNAFGEAIGNFFSSDLPNGTKLNIPEGGFEDNFLSYIKDGKFEAGKYYAFDRLYFNTGSSSLDANSMNQIENVAAIMKAYPEVKILFRGHTDNTGSVAGNNKLSASRALSVKNKLVEMGVATSRVNTKGMGSADPIADNGTAEGRAKNRRIDVSIEK